MSSHAILYRGLRRTTDPTDRPVTAEQVITHARQANHSESEYIETLIDTATEAAERYMRRALLTQSWTMFLDDWPGQEGDWWDLVHSTTTRARDLWIPLPYAPLQSVTSVDTYDESDVATSVTVATVFFVDTGSEPGRLVLRSTQTWPVDVRRAAKIKIIYKAGYGDAATNVPAGIKQGIIQHTTWKYQNRGDQSEEESMRKSGAMSQYQRYRIYGL